jgi:glucoamylase
VADEVLSDTYFPTIDNTNVKTLQFVVTDGSTFTDLQTRDTTYTVQLPDANSLQCQVTTTARQIVRDAIGRRRFWDCHLH